MVAGLSRRHGWHIELHVGGSDLADHYTTIAALPGPLVIDHLGRVDLGSASSSAAVDALVRLLDRGDVWVKLSGILVGLIAQIVPDPDDRRLMLIDNPEELLEGSGTTSR
jgi:predicted TIM-barrel fold metal-dependent hydrolase